MAHMLNQRLSPPARLRRAWFCDSCRVIVDPRVDSGGTHCPYCHQDLKSPMERKPATAPLSQEQG